MCMAVPFIENYYVYADRLSRLSALFAGLFVFVIAITSIAIQKPLKKPSNIELLAGTSAC